MNVNSYQPYPRTSQNRLGFSGIYGQYVDAQGNIKTIEFPEDDAKLEAYDPYYKQHFIGPPGHYIDLPDGKTEIYRDDSLKLTKVNGHSEIKAFNNSLIEIDEVADQVKIKAKTNGTVEIQKVTGEKTSMNAFTEGCDSGHIRIKGYAKVYLDDPYISATGKPKLEGKNLRIH